MKKYLFGVFAIAVAIVFSAFNNPSQNSEFTYIGPTTGDITAALEDESNWQVGGSPSLECAGADATCRFSIPSQYEVDNLLHEDITLDFNDGESDPDVYFEVTTPVTVSGEVLGDK